VPFVVYQPLDGVPNQTDKNGVTISNPLPVQKSGQDLVDIRQALSNIGLVVKPGIVESDSFVMGSSGWRLTAEGVLYAYSGVFGGALIAGELHVPDRDTTANSAHISTTGLMWFGATETNKATAPVVINPTGLITLGDPTGVHIQLDGPNKRIQSSDYSTGVKGFYIDANLIESQNLIARGIMRGSTFAYDVISAIAGQVIISNSDVLATDMTALDASTLTTRGTSTYAVNDMLTIRAVTALGIQEEQLRVTNIASAPTYTVTRDLAGMYAANTNPIWIKGTTVVKQGVSDGAAAYSGGWLRLFGEGTNSPYYSVFARTGVAYNSYAEQCRLGNLNGWGGFVADTYGLALGNYSTGKYLTYDSVSGNLNVNGYVPFTKGVFGGDGSDGALAISSGTTDIDCGGAQVVTKNYTSISITGTAKLTFSNKHANGTVVFLKSQGAVTITSSTVPAIDISSMGASAATAGQSGIYRTTQGNVGGTGIANPPSGIAGGTAVSPIGYYESHIGGKTIRYACGSGGGSGGPGGSNGGAPSGGAGGPGGIGGGALVIECRGALNITSTLYATGGVGTVGGAGSDRGGGGGGGGGAGGTIVIVYNTLTANSGTYTVTGGAGGDGGASSGSGGGQVGGGGGGSGGTNRASSGAGGAGGGAAANGSAGSAGSNDSSNGGAGGDGGILAPFSTKSGGGGGGGGSGGVAYVVENTQFA
jgi:hypothetical protein